MHQEWNRAKRYLAISPHPDDVELGCGGTVASLARDGREVLLAVFTDGRLGTRDPELLPEKVAGIRAEEQRAAAAELGVELRMLGLPDGGPHDYYRLRDLAVGLIRTARPDYVLVCDPFLPYETHSDHRLVGLAASEAVLLSGLPHYAAGQGEPHNAMGVVYYFPGRPNVLAPLTAEDVAARARAIACHRSQFSPGDEYLLRLEEQRRRGGERAGVLAAEPLLVRRRTELHVPDPAED